MFWDPDADAAFVRSLRNDLRPDITIHDFDHHVNDPRFGEIVADLFVDLLRGRRPIHSTTGESEMTTDSLLDITEAERAFREQFVSWNLAELSYVDIRAYLEEKDMVLVPMASTEQHGPHLPLYCDTITAIEISARVSRLIGVLHTPPIWTGYSPQHMHRPGEGRGTITVRSTTLLALMEDVARSLIHHGFNRIVFVNGHGSNIKVVDPVLRKLRYETGALIGLVKPYMERYVGVVEGIFENPPEETPGWHSSEWETSQCLAWNEDLVRMDRAEHTPTSIPDFLPESFRKFDGAPDVEFEGYTYFNFPDGSSRVHRDRGDRQPDARHQGEGRGVVPEILRARGSRCARAHAGAGQGREPRVRRPGHVMGEAESTTVTDRAYAQLRELLTSDSVEPG